MASRQVYKFVCGGQIYITEMGCVAGDAGKMASTFTETRRVHILLTLGLRFSMVERVLIAAQSLPSDLLVLASARTTGLCENSVTAVSHV